MTINWLGLRSVKLTSFAAFIALVLSHAYVASAQSYPPFPVFNPSTQVSNIELLGSPAMRTLSNSYFSGIVIAYQDSNNGNNLTIANSTDGINFYNQHSLGISIAADPAMAIYNGYVYIAYVANGDIYTTRSTDGYNFENPTVVPRHGIVYNWRPAIAESGGKLWLAYSGTAYDSSSQLYDGPWVTTEVSDDGVNWYYPFLTPPGTYQPIPVDGWNADSGPSLVDFNGTLFLCYLTATFKNPDILYLGQNGWTRAALNQGGYAQDPEMVIYHGNMYIFMRSFDSSDHLFAIGSEDGFNWTPDGNWYGQTLTGVPALSVLLNGALVQTGRTNYPGDGPYLWTAVTSD